MRYLLRSFKCAFRFVTVLLPRAAKEFPLEGAGMVEVMLKWYYQMVLWRVLRRCQYPNAERAVAARVGKRRFGGYNAISARGQMRADLSYLGSDVIGVITNMKTVEFGATGVKVSESAPGHADVRRLVAITPRRKPSSSAALASGINFVDTAAMYSAGRVRGIPWPYPAGQARAGLSGDQGHQGDRSGPAS